MGGPDRSNPWATGPDGVVLSEQLAQRPTRPSDHATENRAIASLLQVMADRPQSVLQELVETALVLCRAEGAAVGILEPGGPHGVLRWQAASGSLGNTSGGLVQGGANALGSTFTHGAVLLLDHADQLFPELRGFDPPILENLVTPLLAEGRPVGALWVVTHVPGPRFDPEDARLLSRLSRIASVAQLLSSALKTARASQIAPGGDQGGPSPEGPAGGIDGAKQRQSFALRLSDALRPLADPTEIQQTAARILTEHLDVSRAYYVTVSRASRSPGDPSGSTRAINRNPEWMSVLSRSPDDTADDTVHAQLARGERLIVPDTTRLPVSGSGQIPTLETLDVRSFLAVPLVKAGRFVAALEVIDTVPRDWTDLEIGLVEETAERTWAAVERAEAEAALRESEERFRALVTAGANMIYRMSPDWRHMYLLSGRGILADTVEPVEGWAETYLLPEDRDEIFAVIAEAIRTRSTFELEHRVLRADGGVGWVLSRAIPIHGPDGAIVEWFGAGSDVTGRKRVEEERERLLGELNVQHGRLRAIMDSLPVGVWIADADGKMLEINGAARELWGGRAPAANTVEEYGMYRAWWAEGQTAIGPEDMPLARALRGETMKDRLVDYERFDGIRGSLVVSAAPVLDGEGRAAGAVCVAQDISKLKEAEAALRRSEGRLRLALEAARMGIWTLDPATGTQSRDANLNRLLGLEPVEWSGPFEEFLTRVHPDDRLEVRRGFDASRIEGRPLSIEFRVVRPNGVVRWLRDQGDVFGEAEGPARYMAGACVDITDLKQAEAALRAGEERLRGAFAIRTVGVIFWKEDFRITEVNDAFSAMTGFTPDEAIGKTWKELTPPEFHEDSEVAVREMMTLGESTPYEKQYYRKDGSRWWGLFAGRRVGDEFVEFVLDVTRRNEAEAAVRASEERLRLILASAVDYAVFALDQDRRVTSWSPGAEAIFGISEPEVLGQLVDPIFTPEDRQAGIPDEEARTALRKGRAADDRWHVRKDGSRFFASGVLTPLGEGGTLGFVKVLSDLTARKRMEDALREARDRLEARVAERTEALASEMGRRAELARRLATAQEAERLRVARDLHDSVGQLLAGLGLAVRAAEESGPLPPAAVVRLAEVRRVADLLGREVHALATRLRPTSLDDLGLEAALTQLAGEWSARAGVPVDLQIIGVEGGRLPSEVETVLFRVVQEALTNVARHARASAVSVVVGRLDGMATAVVEDDGVGFDTEAIGAGRLGLLGMRERIEQAGGELEIESEPGRGTAVIARIPVRGGGGDTP